MKNKNKKHWDDKGSNYENIWKNNSKKYMHSMEMDFINYFLSKNKNRRVLDIGIGTGRIVENYISSPCVDEIYGIDISDEMIKICKGKFLQNRKIKRITVCDFSKNTVPFDTKFDFISAIRVLKYNKNWIEMIEKIEKSLTDGGIAIITMPNRISLNVFGTYSIPYYKTSKKEIDEICKNSNLQIMEMKTFT